MSSMSNTEPPAGIREFSVQRFRHNAMCSELDDIAIEQPLEIRIIANQSGKPHEHAISITMRTPGQDAKLAIGFLVTEGILQRQEDVVATRVCRSGSVVRVKLRAGLQLDLDRLQRHFYTSSSCGVCGKASIDAVSVQIQTPLQSGMPTIQADLLGQLPERLRTAQSLFERTGGLHASGLFETSGNLLEVEEDVGRHNALDKLIGGQWLKDAQLFPQSVLVLSGRISFELVQKALVVGIPIVIAVGAPSSLAIELAQRHGMTLVGFAKPDRFNVYNDSNRIL
ncbi:formate dehydrogenase accessory sulfurtransferase FdhD [Aureliella helgolandensis]|uniref:Sulfur carrier protein FdhD n=1 Tax=Aureliella helgolandensis TaxID=2527968 RepID=A0A518G7N6_9BACT|nr:formate dehydrogenase accessory sulfurtransferase FdhD [Aureliella helgolandensis]QDV24601.1 formate dehydrogenase accessory protein [Aureliella helgolandensis]